MVYWVTTTAHSSARMYYEFAKGLASGSLDLFTRPTIPVGYTRYPNEIMFTSRRWAEAQYPLSHFADMDRGGHFAAFEVPELFVPDVRTCFRSTEGLRTEKGDDGRLRRQGRGGDGRGERDRPRACPHRGARACAS